MDIMIVIYAFVIIYVISTFMSACMSIQAGVEIHNLLPSGQRLGNVCWVVWHLLEAVSAVAILLLFPVFYN